MDASQFRGPSLALRIAALLVGTQTVLASGTSALILLIAIGGRGGFSTLGTGTIDNQAQWVLIFGLATAAIAGTGGATVVVSGEGEFGRPSRRLSWRSHGPWW